MKGERPFASRCPMTASVSRNGKPSTSSPNDFEDLDPGLRSAILQASIRKFQFQKLRNPAADQFFAAQQIAAAQAGIGAPDRRVESQFNAPVIAGVPGMGRQGQQG